MAPARGRARPIAQRCGGKRMAVQADDAMLEAHREELIDRALDKALEGDSVSLWKLLDRVMPAPRGRPVRLALPALRTLDDVNEAQIAVGVALASGVVTPTEAAVINRGVIEPRRKMIETHELERRIAALERHPVE
jgi:hypothetical protein